jgi:3-oxoadipate enol-lactonase
LRFFEKLPVAKIGQFASGLLFVVFVLAAVSGALPRAAIGQPSTSGPAAVVAQTGSPEDLSKAGQTGKTSPLTVTPTEADYLAVENGRIFYEVFGEGFPIVFIHDGIAHREVWDDQVLDLYPDYRVIRYDRRGYGKSDEPTQPYSNIADLHALVEHLKLDRAVFVGSSAGGGLAINYALAHPERVEALVLVGAVVDGLGVSFHFMKRGYENFSLDPEKSLENWLNDVYAIAPGNDDARARLEGLLRANPQDLSRAKSQLAQDPETPALPRLGEIRVPTLIVTADKDIPDVHAHAGAIEAGITVSRRIVLEDAGHLVYLERPAAFNDALREFFSLITLPRADAVAARAKEPWSNFERGFCPVPNGEIYYEMMGKGEPLVLIHGGAMDHRMWDDQFEKFAKKYRVIRYDVRGSGLSRSPYGGHRDYEELGILLDHLKIAKAHLVGLSLGGRIVVDFAIVHPDRVLKLIPVSPGISGYEFNAEPEQKCTQEIREAYMAADFEKAAEAFLEGWTVGPKRKVEDVDEAFRQRVLALIRENMKPGLDMGHMLEAEPPAIGRLAEIKAPTMVVIGNLDMPGILDIADRIEKQVPGAKKVVIKGAAHTVNMEKPEKFNSVVLKFMEK